MPNRISLTDSPLDILKKLSAGNPGALTALIDLYKKYPAIDPDACPIPDVAILHLTKFDDLDIIGPKIWVLYKDQCDHDAGKVIGLLRAHQLGYLSADRLKQICDSRDPQNLLSVEEVNSLLGKVKAELPLFNA